MLSIWVVWDPAGLAIRTYPEYLPGRFVRKFVRRFVRKFVRKSHLWGIWPEVDGLAIPGCPFRRWWVEVHMGSLTLTALPLVSWVFALCMRPDIRVLDSAVHIHVSVLGLELLCSSTKRIRLIPQCGHSCIGNQLPYLLLSIHKNHTVH